MNFFLNLLNSATHLVDLGRRQGTVDPVVNKKSSTARPKYDDPEVAILAAEFGDLYEGKTITVDLHRLLALLPRARKKADAYKGIRAKISKLGVELNITSTRSHKHN